MKFPMHLFSLRSAVLGFLLAVALPAAAATAPVPASSGVIDNTSPQALIQ
ncbi:MAG: hypothetical protein RL030_412, partial [Pseudomonadota bacterium]